MKLLLDTHITEIAFNLNHVSYTANAQTIDSINSQFFFSIGRLSGIFISPNICLLLALFFSMRVTPITKDTTDLTNLILNQLHILGKRNHKKCQFQKKNINIDYKNYRYLS